MQTINRPPVEGGAFQIHTRIIAWLLKITDGTPIKTALVLALTRIDS